jgi:hypothetical protein
LTIIKGNIAYLEELLPHLAEGMYETKESNLSNYIKYLRKYSNLIDQYDNNEKEDTFAGLKNILIVLLNDSELLPLNDLMNEYAFHYLDSDEEVKNLLHLIWNYFFPNERWKISEKESVMVFKKEL